MPRFENPKSIFQRSIPAIIGIVALGPPVHSANAAEPGLPHQSITHTDESTFFPGTIRLRAPVEDRLEFPLKIEGQGALSIECRRNPQEPFLGGTRTIEDKLLFRSIKFSSIRPPAMCFGSGIKYLQEITTHSRIGVRNVPRRALDGVASRSSYLNPKYDASSTIYLESVDGPDTVADLGLTKFGQFDAVEASNASSPTIFCSRVLRANVKGMQTRAIWTAHTQVLQFSPEVKPNRVALPFVVSAVYGYCYVDRHTTSRQIGMIRGTFPIR